MALGNIVQKAVYLGIGLASYAGENLGEMREQAQKLADEMVERGKMNAEEARQYVDKLVQQAQQELEQKQGQTSSKTSHSEPRRIEIIEDEEVEEASSQEDIDKLRQQVQSLQDELRNIKNK